MRGKRRQDEEEDAEEQCGEGVENRDAPMSNRIRPLIAKVSSALIALPGTSPRIVTGRRGLAATLALFLRR
ncbi:hypothetical protein [Mesorhizobium sp. C264A]|uniref:hypothetical protein n=1 Tax=Mesorhizobium sp. C264A TaxID=2956825 RepID=UPI00333DD24A